MSDIDTSAAHAASTAGLGRKVGPLPIWGWAVLLIGAVALFLYIRSRSSGTVADNNGAGLSSTTDQTAAGALSTLYGGGGTGYTSGYSNNQAYEQAAISELSGSTQYTPLQIQGALGNLFAGNQLSSTDQSIVNEIESALGAPPEYVPTPSVAPTTQQKAMVYYVPGNASYALITPDNKVYMTQSVGAANAWAAQYSPNETATRLTVPDWNAIYAKAQAANPTKPEVIYQ